MDSESKGRVLIIDDSSFIIKQLTQILLGGSYEMVGTANNGEEGVKLYKSMQDKVDLILCDINMPVQDGITTLAQIKALNPKAKVVMISTQSTMDTVKKAIMLGAKSFIVKPPVYKTVLERINSVLGHV